MGRGFDNGVFTTGCEIMESVKAAVVGYRAAPGQGQEGGSSGGRVGRASASAPLPPAIDLPCLALG